jgi:deoxyribonuclease V
VDPGGNIIGHALRTQDDTNVVFVSPGHKIGIKEASEIILNCSPKYRLPEPIRKADQEADKFMKEGDI